jgi:YfiH family protein
MSELSARLHGGGQALFTDRSHGNLSTAAGEDCERGLRRRGELCAQLGMSWLCASPQLHSTRVQRVRSRAKAGGEPAEEAADGHATDRGDVAVMVLAADCLPVALGCEGAIAVVHAGWRGLAAGVLEEGVRALKELGSGPIEAVIGPCAGACCYEVGPEVHRALGSPSESKANIDLRAIAHEHLHAAGVAKIGDLGGCTICDERFFSFRREGERAGRQGAIAWLS